MDPPVFNGDTLKVRVFRKKGIVFSDCCRFRDVFEGAREILIADGDLSYTQIRAMRFSVDEIERRQKTYQFLQTPRSSEVDRGFL